METGVGATAANCVGCEVWVWVGEVVGVGEDESVRGCERGRGGGVCAPEG